MSQRRLDGLFDSLFLTMVIRILVILVLSGLIGFEREVKNHSAGFRTHILVGIGSCLMMLLSLYGFESFRDGDFIRFDPARIPSYVISGIGFLGAGTIIVYGGTIRGLTTAASIWAVAGLGLVVGIGMYGIAIFTTIIILLSLTFLNNLEKLFVPRRTTRTIEVVGDQQLALSSVIEIVESMAFVVEDIEIEKTSRDLRHFYIRLKRQSSFERGALFAELSRLEDVKQVSERD